MGKQARLRETRKALQGLIAKERISVEQAVAQYRKEKGRPSSHAAEVEWQAQGARWKGRFL